MAIYNRSTTTGKYGITPEEFDQIMEVQDGVCAGCHRAPSTLRHLDIDHKHQRREAKASPESRRPLVRGALCHRCNRALGVVFDSPETLRNLADYLDNPPAQSVLQ